MTWRWPNFTPGELACKGTGAAFPLSADTEAFLDRLQALRDALGFPFVITSGYRSPAHNSAVGGVGDSPHVKGRAVDIRVYGERALMVVSYARQFGFTGVGVSQKGAHGARFIHLDDTEGPARPGLWSY